MLFTSSRQWVLAGLLSYSGGCWKTGNPTVATRLTAYLSWLSAMNVTGTVTVSEMSPFNATDTDMATTTFSSITSSSTRTTTASSNITVPTTVIMVSTTTTRSATHNSAQKLSSQASIDVMLILSVFTLLLLSTK